MTVYVDDMRRRARVGKLSARWSHLMADTTDELLTFADRIGLERVWLQKPGTRHEHFDVTDSMREAAIEAGAVPIRYLTDTPRLLAAKREGVAFVLAASS